jgi:hypothetical protein
VEFVRVCEARIWYGKECSAVFCKVTHPIRISSLLLLEGQKECRNWVKETSWTHLRPGVWVERLIGVKKADVPE